MVEAPAVSEARPSSPPVPFSPRSLFSTSVFRPTFPLLVPLPRLLPVSQGFGEDLELELPSLKLRSELFAPLPYRVSLPSATAAAAFSAAVAASTAPCVAAAPLSGLLSSLRFLSRASSSLALVPLPPPPPRPFA